MKKVMLLCTSHNDLGLIRALRKLGYYIVATGNRENSPGEVWTDKWIKADYSNEELIFDIAVKERIDAVCVCCNDFGVYTAAYVAEKLGLPGYDSYETTLLLHNKDKFKDFAQKHGIITPSSKSFLDKEDAIEAIRDMELPVIVKPVDASAGNGISIIKNYNDGKKAVMAAFENSRAGRVLVESYIAGSQHGFCTYLLNQKVVACCSNNEYSILNPYRVEIDTFPAENWQEYQQVLVNQIEKMADILKLKDGIFHLQYICKDGKPWIIEVMRRTIGNMYHVPGNLLTGIDWEFWEAKARCGIDCSDFPQPVSQQGYYAYKTILAPKNGVIADICIPEEYEKYIFNKYILLKRGGVIIDCKREPVGFLFMMFADKEEMEKVLVEEYKGDLVKIV